MPLLGSAKAERRGTPADHLVIGLGNPGTEFAGTRHNVGVEVVEELARRAGTKLKRSKAKALTGDAHIAGNGSPSRCRRRS